MNKKIVWIALILVGICLLGTLIATLVSIYLV
ncbi:hypothetical protein LFLEISCH_03760 [Listeria fleischmannii subsp. fleischmannii LU2006-1]|nr:hypothetical protein LFLEISCH_03760 [Listeria fleischmannii subsp. fleischmannii LU2006-1]